MAFWVKKLQLGQFLEKWVRFSGTTEGGGWGNWSQSLSLDACAIIAVCGALILEFANYEMKTGYEGRGVSQFNMIFVNFYVCAVSWHQSQSVANSTDGPGHENLIEGHLTIWSLSQFLLLDTYCTILVAERIAKGTPGHLEEGLARTLMLVQVPAFPTIQSFSSI